MNTFQKNKTSRTFLYDVFDFIGFAQALTLSTPVLERSMKCRLQIHLLHHVCSILFLTYFNTLNAVEFKNNGSLLSFIISLSLSDYSTKRMLWIY